MDERHARDCRVWSGGRKRHSGLISNRCDDDTRRTLTNDGHSAFVRASNGGEAISEIDFALAAILLARVCLLGVSPPAPLYDSISRLGSA